MKSKWQYLADEGKTLTTQRIMVKVISCDVQKYPRSNSCYVELYVQSFQLLTTKRHPELLYKLV